MAELGRGSIAHFVSNRCHTRRCAAGGPRRTAPSRTAPAFEFPPDALPDLVGLDPDQAVVVLAAAFVPGLSDLPDEPLDEPAPRKFVTDVLVPGDGAILEAPRLTPW